MTNFPDDFLMDVTLIAYHL